MSSKHDNSTQSSSSSTTPLIVLLPYNHHRRRNYHRLRRCILLTTTSFLLILTLYLLYPSDPTIQLTRLTPNHIQIQTTPKPTLSLSFSVTVKVRNPDFFSLSYNSVNVSVGYRGRDLGIVTSDGGSVKARGVSYVDATLVVDGFEIVHDVFYLIEDLASGVLPFDTTTHVRGWLGVLFLNVPIKGRVSCEVYVNVHNHTVVRQDCYP